MSSCKLLKHNVLRGILMTTNMEHPNPSIGYFWTSLRICIAITVGHSLTIFTVTGTFTGNFVRV